MPTEDVIYVNEQGLRERCLRLAVNYLGRGYDADMFIESAQKFYDFIKGNEKK
jgi:hypothetical protein